jgi:DNA-binding GntR family transcriptional regulator
MPDNVIEYAPVKTGSLRARVFETLREAIFSGKLQPGDPIREAHMARALHVSQPTVREALLQLEHAGLVVRNPQRDTIVTRLTPEDIRERSHLRVILEPEAGIAAVAHMGGAEFQTLQERLEAIHEALARDSYFDFVAADLEFHRTIWSYASSPTLYKVLELVTVPMFASLSIQRSHILKDLAHIVRSHDPIVAALRSGQPGEIREAFRQHLDSSYRNFGS